MKLSFTTLGTLTWDIETLISNAKTFGFDAIDFRGYLGENDVWQLPAFADGAQATADRIRGSGLEVSCFSSSIRLLFPDEDKPKHLAEAREYIRLALIFGTPFIRVFGGYLKDAGLQDFDAGADRAGGFLAELAGLAADTDISFLVETHDDWIAGADIALLLDRANAGNTGIIWDIHHPFRSRGEAMQTTWDLIGPRVRYTHFKDSRPTDSGHQLCLPGTGDIPIAEAVAVLKQGGYDGYLALEWEKKWHPEIEEPEVALPAFTALMRPLL